jgi:hypothetical protein
MLNLVGYVVRHLVLRHSAPLSGFSSHISVQPKARMARSGVAFRLTQSLAQANKAEPYR